MEKIWKASIFFEFNCLGSQESILAVPRKLNLMEKPERKNKNGSDTWKLRTPSLKSWDGFLSLFPITCIDRFLRNFAVYSRFLRQTSTGNKNWFDDLKYQRYLQTEVRVGSSMLLLIGRFDESVQLQIVSFFIGLVEQVNSSTTATGKNLCCKQFEKGHGINL